MVNLARYRDPLAVSHVQFVLVAPVPYPVCDINMVLPENCIVPYLLSAQLPVEGGNEQALSISRNNFKKFFHSTIETSMYIHVCKFYVNDTTKIGNLLTLT